MLRSFQDLSRHTLAASDGRIGTIYEFYFDDSKWKVRYLIVHTGSRLSGELAGLEPSLGYAQAAAPPSLLEKRDDDFNVLWLPQLQRGDHTFGPAPNLLVGMLFARGMAR